MLFQTCISFFLMLDIKEDIYLITVITLPLILL